MFEARRFSSMSSGTCPRSPVRPGRRTASVSAIRAAPQFEGMRRGPGRRDRSVSPRARTSQRAARGRGAARARELTEANPLQSRRAGRPAPSRTAAPPPAAPEGCMPFSLMRASGASARERTPPAQRPDDDDLLHRGCQVVPDEFLRQPVAAGDRVKEAQGQLVTSSLNGQSAINPKGAEVSLPSQSRTRWLPHAAAKAARVSTARAPA